MGEVVKVNNQVDTFGYAVSDRRCRVCRERMHDVAYVEKYFGGVVYGFRGYKCFRCGHEEIVHEKGGVLGGFKKQMGIRG